MDLCTDTKTGQVEPAWQAARRHNRRVLSKLSQWEIGPEPTMAFEERIF